MAQYQTDMSVKEILADKLVTCPLTRWLCAPVGDDATDISVKQVRDEWAGIKGIEKAWLKKQPARSNSGLALVCTVYPRQ